MVSLAKLSKIICKEALKKAFAKEPKEAKEALEKE